MLLQILGVVAALAGFALVLWAGFRAARQAGAAEARQEEAEHVVQNAERITAARDAAPGTVGELADGVRGGKRRL